MIFGEKLGVLLPSLGGLRGHGAPAPTPAGPWLMRPGHPETPCPKSPGHLPLFRALWQGGGKAWPAAYGAGFVNFLPLPGRCRRRGAALGQERPGPGAVVGGVREGASGDGDGPQMLVMSCPRSAPVGQREWKSQLPSPPAEVNKGRKSKPTSREIEHHPVLV